MADQEIPELKREQLGKGVRGKYLKNFTQVLADRASRVSRKRAAV